MTTAKLSQSRVCSAKTFFALVCVAVFLCTFAVSCGGGGGGGASGVGAVNTNLSLSVKIDGFSAAKNATDPNLLWETIDLSVYIDGEKSTFTLTPDTPTVRIEHVTTGAEAWAEAVIHIQGGETRNAKSEVITVAPGANKLTLYAEYTVTFDINTDDYALFASGNTEESTTYTKQSFGAPQYELMPEYANHKIAYWCTDPANPTSTRFVPGVTTGDIDALYACWEEGPIVFTKTYYESGVSNFEVVDESQLIQLASLSNNENKDFTDKTITITKNLTMSGVFEGIATGTTQFNGTFDGGGYTITLNINTDTNKVALIGVNGGTVKNVIAAGAVTGGPNSAYTGGIVAYNGGTIEHCANRATVSSNGGSGIDCGGICALNSSGVITICYNEGVLENRRQQGNFGGICGEDQGGLIQHVYCGNGKYLPSSGTAGGVVGRPDENTMLLNCYSHCSNAGGRISQTVGYSSAVTADNCENVFTRHQMGEQNKSYITSGLPKAPLLALLATPWVDNGTNYPTLGF